MSTVTTATSTATATVLAASPQTSVSEAVVFWIVAPVAIAAAMAMVFSRHAVHEALFLFVLMLVGVDSSDSLVETLRGQRAAAAALALGFVVLLIGAIGSATLQMPSQGLAAANAEGNVIGIARLLFTRYVFAFEATSALLITAALGAMVLAHKEQVVPRVSQREMSRRRFAGEHPTPYPSPGVFARHDAVDTPALLPDGTAAEPRPPVLEGSSNQAGRAGDPAGPGATGSGS